MHRTMLIVCAGVALLVAAPARGGDNVYTEGGLVKVRPVPVDESVRNQPWPAEMEQGFWERANHAIQAFKGKSGGNTYGENEKGSYPACMFDYLAGNRDRAVECLTGEDAQAGKDHKHTLGIDLYWCFTLKGQIRKYFFFGKHLGAIPEPYMKRMYDAARIWTAEDPLRRPHPVYGKGSGGPGWGPDVKGSWVDTRGTDNLRAMRDTSVYLFAEETGNEAVRRLALDRIRAYVVGLYHGGMGEWDSENYHAHTIAPYLNLYDFAKDPEATRLAKAALDWLSAAGALKYWRGGYGGPTKRDYGGGNVVFGAGVSHMMYLWFDDAPLADPEPHYDDVHAVTSAYRPPLAVVGLARKDFARPVEIVSTKPPYANFDPDAPETWETLFFGDTYYVGTAAAKSPVGDVGPFKLLAANSKRGVDYVVAYTGDRPNTMRTGDQIGQYRNLVVWLRPGDGTPFRFQVPKSATVEQGGGAIFIGLEKAFVAILPINLAGPMRTEAVEGKRAKDYAAEQVLALDAAKAPYTGFAMVAGDTADYPDLAAFRKAVAAKARLDLSKVAQGAVTLVGPDGRKLQYAHNPDEGRPIVVRDGKPRRWDAELDLYRPVDADAPIRLGWKQGTLTVTAGGHTFTETVTKDGKVTFSDN